MPRGDGTGPQGRGPMTGRSMGYCAKYDRPGFTNDAPRRGAGNQRGFRANNRGRGFQRSSMYNPRGSLRPRFQGYQEDFQPQEQTKEQELDILKQEAKAVEDEQKELNKELDSIRKRIDELKGQQGQE